MSGALQAVFQNQRSFGLTIGAAFGGGFFAGQISTAGNGIADYNLVVGPYASANLDNSSAIWKNSNTNTNGTNSFSDGPTNSSNMNNASHPGAQFCEALTIGGYTDWYMPAKNEQEICYYNLKPTTTANDTGSGINANAVPTRTSSYTTGTPARTSATNFYFPSGSEAYTSASYWCSTQFSATKAYRLTFYNGNQYNFYPNKTAQYRLRAIRRVAV